MATQSQKIYEAFARKLRAEERRAGREEGVVGAHREAIDEVCRARGLALSTEQREMLSAELDADVLRRWLGRAATASGASEIFANA